MTGRNYLGGFFKGEPLSRDREAPAEIPARKATAITPIIEFVLEDPNVVVDLYDGTSHVITGTTGPIIVSQPFYLEPPTNDSILRVKNTVDYEGVVGNGGARAVLVYRNTAGELIPVGFSGTINAGENDLYASLDENMLNSDGVWEVYRQYWYLDDGFGQLYIGWSNWSYHTYIADEIAELNPVGEAFNSGVFEYTTSVFNTDGKTQLIPVRSIDRSPLSKQLDMEIEVRAKITDPGQTIQIVFGSNEIFDVPGLLTETDFVQINEVDADVDGVITQTITYTMSHPKNSWDYILYFRVLDAAGYVDAGEAEFIGYTVTYDETL